LFDIKLEIHKNGEVKTTLDIPDDLVREVKLRAVNEGRKLKDVISDLLRQGLGHEAMTSAGTDARRGSIEIPFFQSSVDAPAALMSLDQLVAIEREALTQEDHERIHTSA